MKLYPRNMEPLANDSFEARIVRALEQQPSSANVPTDFAARVTAALPAQRPARRASHAGRTVTLIVAAMLVVAMIALAPHTAASLDNRAFDAELAIVLILAAIAWAMSTVWDRV